MSAEASIPGSQSQQFQMILRRLLGSRQWERAVDVARDWLSHEPENAEAHMAAGQALVNLKRYKEADAHISKVLSARPDNSFAFRLASIAAFNQQKQAKADEHIRRAIELNPNDAMHWYQLSLMRYRQGNLSAAEQHARRSLELYPDNAETINLLALCKKGDPSGQLSDYLRALEINPESSVVHTNIGSHYLYSAHNPKAAEESFRRALQCDPTNEAAQKGLFNALRLRDPIYYTLTLPRNLLFAASWNRRDRTMLVRIVLLGLWLWVGHYLVIAFAAWLMLVFPLVKAYEYLTLSDIRSRAGMVGARRGGWGNFHRWPLPARLAIFGLLVLCFWGGLYWLFAKDILPLHYLIVACALTLVVWYCSRIPGWSRYWRGRTAASRGERQLKRQRKASEKEQGRTRQPDPY